MGFFNKGVGSTAGLVASAGTAVGSIGNFIKSNRWAEVGMHSLGGGIQGAMLGGIVGGWGGAAGGFLGGSLGGAAYGQWGAPAYRKYDPAFQAFSGAVKYGKNHTGILANGAAKAARFTQKHYMGVNQAGHYMTSAMSAGAAGLIGASMLSSNESRR